MTRNNHVVENFKYSKDCNRYRITKQNGREISAAGERPNAKPNTYIIMASDTTPKVNGTQVVKEPLGDVLHIIDSRTRQHYTVDVHQNSINATDLKAIKAPKDAEHPEYQNEQGLRVYDPGYSNTLVSESKITYMQVITILCSPRDLGLYQSFQGFSFLTT